MVLDFTKFYKEEKKTFSIFDFCLANQGLFLKEFLNSELELNSFCIECVKHIALLHFILYLSISEEKFLLSILKAVI